MEEKKKFTPFKKGWKVKVLPIIKTGWLGKNHAAAVMFDQTSINITVPYDKSTGHLKQVLTKEERDYFESGEFDFVKGELDHRKGERHGFEENYWKNFSVRISKPLDGVLKPEDPLLILDLSSESKDYHQYFMYKVLLANSNINGIVAPSWDKRRASGAYKIVLVDEEEVETEIITKYHREKKINDFLGKIDTSPTKLYEFLFICYLEDPALTEPSDNADVDWYIRELEKLKELKPKLLLKIIEKEKDYSYRVMIHKGIRCGALKYNRNQGILSSEGVNFGYNVEAAINYLKDDRFQKDLFKLEHRIEEFSKKKTIISDS